MSGAKHHNPEKLIGVKFRALTVLEIVKPEHGRKAAKCLCDCGTERMAAISDLRFGRTTSCGCLKILRNKSNRINITGKRFGMLVAIEVDESVGKKKMVYWRCLCDCGQVKTVFGTDLRQGKINSCGCNRGVGNIRHGYARRSLPAEDKALYKAWHAMCKRCTDPENRGWKNYGGRGIAAHPPWLESYECFANYVKEFLGVRPAGTSLDRIDNDGNYQPGNVRWASRNAQSENRRGKANGTSPFKGVVRTLRKFGHSYRACITPGGKQIRLGVFETEIEAAKAYNEAAKKYFGSDGYLNKIDRNVSVPQ